MTVAVIVELLGAPGNKGEIVNFTCANQNAIAKGELLWLTDPRTVSGAATYGDGQPAAGIAASEKVAGDGQTTIGVYTNGIFDIVSNDHVITAGTMVIISGQNVVDRTFSGTYNVAYISGLYLGKALETSDGSNEVITVKVRT